MPIAGKPLIAWTIEAAQRATSLTRLVVSTDDEAIAAEAARRGVEVVRRPAAIARVDSPIDEAMRHAAEMVEPALGRPIGIVVCMQANVPVRRPEDIDAAVARLGEAPWATAAATAYRVRERPEWMKRVCDPATGEIEPLMDAGTNYRMQDLPDLYLLDGAVVAVRAEVLRRTRGDRRVHAYMGERVVAVLHDPTFAVEIDTLEDVPLAEFFLGRRAPASSS
jgi:N-acylneuraminate cytidylyltransferase